MPKGNTHTAKIQFETGGKRRSIGITVLPKDTDSEKRVTIEASNGRGEIEISVDEIKLLGRFIQIGGIDLLVNRSDGKDKPGRRKEYKPHDMTVYFQR